MRLLDLLVSCLIACGLGGIFFCLSMAILHGAIIASTVIGLVGIGIGFALWYDE